jgi:hypothetical protein
LVRACRGLLQRQEIAAGTGKTAAGWGIEPGQIRNDLGRTGVVRLKSYC